MDKLDLSGIEVSAEELVVALQRKGDRKALKTCPNTLPGHQAINRHLSAAWVSYSYAHRHATAKKQRHEMAADEAGSAEHRDAVGHRLLSLALYRHRTSCAMLAIHMPGQYILLVYLKSATIITILLQ